MRGKNRGFTLIELMIVLIIISVLASITIVSLNNARKRANDSEVTAQLSIARLTAQLFYEEYGSYRGTGGNVSHRCDMNNSMFTDVRSGMYLYTQDYNYPDGTTLRCSASNQAYQMSASLSTPGEYWCINSAGYSRKIFAPSHSQAHPNNDTDCTP